MLTVGHGTATQIQFATVLGMGNVESIVDVRIAPGSRRHPHFGRAALEQWLPDSGIEYRWDRRLGGFRRLPPGSPDVALRNDSFRAYASHMRTAEFEAAVDDLLNDAARDRAAVMCSESVWWRCHRRLIADYLVLSRGVDVRHLMSDGRVNAHRLTDGVRVGRDGRLVYDAGLQPLPAPSE